MVGRTAPDSFSFSLQGGLGMPVKTHIQAGQVAQVARARVQFAFEQHQGNLNQAAISLF